MSVSETTKPLTYSKVRVCRQTDQGVYEVFAEVAVEPRGGRGFAVPSLVYIVPDFNGTARGAHARARELAWELGDRSVVGQS